MNCPVDGALLQMTERQGIEIDYCPTCRGVWLDRGELDKLIDRSTTAAPPLDPERERLTRDRIYERGRYDDRDDDRRDDAGRSNPPHRKKRGGFLSDIFDID